MTTSLRLTTDHTFHTWPWPRTLNDVLFHLRMSSHLLMTTDISWWLPLLTSSSHSHCWTPLLSTSDDFPYDSLWWLPLMTSSDFLCGLHLLYASTVLIWCLHLLSFSANFYCWPLLLSSFDDFPLITSSDDTLCRIPLWIPMLISSTAFQWWPPLLTSSDDFLLLGTSLDVFLWLLHLLTPSADFLCWRNLMTSSAVFFW